jgi:HEPN domain-containing protein
MSQSNGKYEAGRWWQTAKDDIEAAESLHQTGKFSHACFLSQQSAEKAIKALWFAVDGDPWGHSIQKLIFQFPQQAMFADVETWIENAAQLDMFYIPTRYPNGLPDLTPGQTYKSQDSIQAIEKAKFFLEEVEKLLAKL